MKINFETANYYWDNAESIRNEMYEKYPDLRSYIESKYTFFILKEKNSKKHINELDNIDSFNIIMVEDNEFAEFIQKVMELTKKNLVIYRVDEDDEKFQKEAYGRKIYDMTIIIYDDYIE